MLALQIILGIIALLILILLLPVHLHASFSDNLKVRVGVMFINFTLYPLPSVFKKKKKEDKHKKKKVQKELTNAEEILKEDGVSAVVEYYLEMVRLIETAAKRLARTVTVDKLNINIIVASEDASQTAINYGKVCSVVYPSQALIESVFRVRRRSIIITPDFLREKGHFDGEMKLHVIPMRVLWALLLFFIGYIGNTTTTKTVEQ